MAEGAAIADLKHVDVTIKFDSDQVVVPGHCYCKW
jgi:hypothetical protein